MWRKSLWILHNLNEFLIKKKSNLILIKMHYVIHILEEIILALSSILQIPEIFVSICMFVLKAAKIKDYFQTIFFFKSSSIIS